MKKYKVPIIIVLTIVLTLCTMVALKETSNKYDILMSSTNGTVNYSVVGVKEKRLSEVLPEKLGKNTEFANELILEYLTILKGKSGNIYQVKSKDLYEYCKSNNTVKIDIKSYKFSEYQCFNNEILEFNILDK